MDNTLLKHILKYIVFGGVPFFFFFFIFLYFHKKNTFFKRYINCYGNLPCTRVCDSFFSFVFNVYYIIFYTFIYGIFVCIGGYLIAILTTLLNNDEYIYIIVSASICILVIALLFKLINLVVKYGAMIAASIKAGVFICKKKNMLVIPSGTFRNNNSIGSECAGMEELKISEIYKITRKGGKVLYVHGDFGSRSIKFDDKQYRDECIAMLEMATKKKLSRN